jgi:hypothetical protein
MLFTVLTFKLAIIVELIIASSLIFNFWFSVLLYTVLLLLGMGIHRKGEPIHPTQSQS